MSEDHFDFEKMNDQIPTLSGLEAARADMNTKFDKQIGDWEWYLEATPLPDFASEKLQAYIETLKKSRASLNEFADALETFISGLDEGEPNS